MNEKVKYYLFNEELWNLGIMEGCEIQGNALQMTRERAEETLKVGVSESVYLSGPMDSFEKDTVWNRLILQLIKTEESSIQFSYFASNDSKVMIGDTLVDINELLQSQDKTIMDKLYLMDKLWIETSKNQEDVLLFKAEGRYLWFKLEFITYNTLPPRIEQLRLEFPRQTIADYLPQFYKENPQSFDFLSRFLGVYQSFMGDLEEEIMGVSRYFDPQFVEGDFLKWLGEWVAVDRSSMWQEKQLRQLIQRSFSLYKLKGTKEGLMQILELYIGKRPVIIETYEVMNHYSKSTYEENYKLLYGNDQYVFFVLVDEENVPNQQVLLEIKRIVSLHKPAHTVAEVIVLKPLMTLGGHTYLGLNSNISNNLPLKLDGNTTIPFNTTILEQGGLM